MPNTNGASVQETLSAEAIELSAIPPEDAASESEIVSTIPQPCLSESHQSSLTESSTSDTTTSQWNIRLGLFFTAAGVLLAVVVLYPTWESWVLAKQSTKAADWANAATYRADCQSRKDNNETLDTGCIQALSSTLAPPSHFFDFMNHSGKMIKRDLLRGFWAQDLPFSFPFIPTLVFGLSVYIAFHFREMYPRDKTPYQPVSLLGLTAASIQYTATSHNPCARLSFMINITLFVFWPVALQPIVHNYPPPGVACLRFLAPAALMGIFQITFWPTSNSRQACHGS